MINSNEREVNTNIKENSERYVSLKSSSYYNSDRQQNTNTSLDTKSVSNSPAAFMKRFEESQMLAVIKKSKKMARKNPSDKPLTDEQRYFAEVAKANRELMKERLTKGYSRHFIKQLCGHYMPPVSETGLRSDTLNSVAAKLFVAATPKGKQLRTNWGKDSLLTIGIKLFALDEPYVEGNRKFLSFIRIDTDRIWDSPEQCQDFFRQLSKDGKISCEPHFLVGLKLPTGHYVRPHAIWMLPFGSAIWNEPTKTGFRSAPVNLYHSVYFGLCNALLEAGADAGAPAASQQTKNPLSPEFYTICPQDSHFPDLSEHAEYLDLGHNRDSLTRQAASVQSGMDIEQSNEIFNFLQKAAYRIMSAWHYNADPEFMRYRFEGRVGAISDRLHIELERVLAQSSIRPKKGDGNASYLIATVAEYSVSKFDPAKIQAKRNKGAAMHLVSGVECLKERKAIGGIFAAEKNADRVQKIVFDAVIKAHERGYDMNKSSIAKIASVSRTTVHKYWNSALENLVIYIDNKKCSTQSMIKRYTTIRTNDNNKITSTTTDTGTTRYLESYETDIVSDIRYENRNGNRERVRNPYSEMRMKC